MRNAVLLIKMKIYFVSLDETTVMTIVDCFTFFNELDLLELRLRFLDPHVNTFVIAEANLTHSGNPKPFYYAGNKERFKQWHHKIIYLPVQLSAEGLIFNDDDTTYNPENGSWVLECGQREALAQVAGSLGDDDLVIVSDLDELPDPAVLATIDTSAPKVLSQLFHNYFLNCQNVKGERWWNGSIVCSGKFFKAHGAQVLRDNRYVYPAIKKAGWHFSYLGGVQAIQQKLRSFSHTEYNKEEFMNEAHIAKALEKGMDVLKRKHVRYRFVPLSRYPRELRNLMQQYPQFIKALPWYKRLINFFR